jgi:deoxyribodipyrimidine photo-lyase
MSASVTILWLRRDLRLADHPALIAAAEHAHAAGGKLLPIFIWEPGVMAGHRASSNRTWYLRESLRELSRELEARGSTLMELQGPASSALPALIEHLTTHGVSPAEISLFFTRDHTPYARARDRAVS